MPSFRQKISCEIYTVGLDMAGIGRYDLLEPSRAEPSRAENPRIVKSSLRSFCKINYIITKSFYNCKRFMK